MFGDGEEDKDLQNRASFSQSLDSKKILLIDLKILAIGLKFLTIP